MPQPVASNSSPRSGAPSSPVAPEQPVPQPTLGNGSAAHHPPAEPSRHSRTYAATRDQVGHARAFARDALDGCPMTDDILVLVSELCTNAILHSASSQPGGTFEVRIEIAPGDHVRAEVHDNGGPWNPTPHQDIRGHGLDILANLATTWGRHGNPATGWTVWFRIDWPTA